MQTFQSHFQALALYSAWANQRISADARALPDGHAEKDVGVYFKSLLHTLTHLLQTDRAWLHILGGGSLQEMKLPPAPTTLADYFAHRSAQDAQFQQWIDGLPEAWFGRPFSFESGMQSWRGRVYRGTHASILAHVLNHQTHHRGQAHAALTILGVSEPQPLDILVKGMLNE